MAIKIPDHERNENPSEYADRLGKWYSATVSLAHRKTWGQYLTPLPVAEYMARLFSIEGEVFSLLDPGAGSGVLTCAVAEYLATQTRKPSHLIVAAYETDPVLASLLKSSFAYLKDWLASHEINFEAQVITDDFVVGHAEALRDGLGDNKGLFQNEAWARSFDGVISNPPYFKISKTDRRSKAAATVIHGQPNIYALFMAVSAAVLRPDGQLVFITPRSYAAGPYFRLFRERFFGKMKPEHVHVFTSRKDAFRRDDILQENVIIKARREDKWPLEGRRGHILISSSIGAEDLHRSSNRRVRADLVLDMSSKDKVLHLPTTAEEEAVMEMVREWPGSLSAYGLEISTGPVVPFRSVRFLEKTGEAPGNHAPLLWMEHVSPMRIRWPIPGQRKPQYIKVKDASLKLLVRNKNYVLIRRFSAKEEKRRLVAAPILNGDLKSAWLGLENHLNYIHRPKGELTEEEAWGLAVLYNSSILDSYFRTMNGNTKVSATELRSMPLPLRDGILELGVAAMAAKHPVEEIDGMVAALLDKRSGACIVGESVGGRDSLAEAFSEAATIG